MRILTADQRLAEQSGVKALIIGPSGVGKTSLLRTLSPELLATTLFVDVEAGDLAVADLAVASVRPRTWSDCRDLACVLSAVPTRLCRRPSRTAKPISTRSHSAVNSQRLRPIRSCSSTA